ncbi:GNAT family N-acetyltransferase [Sphingomicrobium clamense]|uniref:GNAT family N-acetyltransferase n=1 Tax=Sphingomicrobium clamense TaxID=2851013 RepID=A0ABS6V799_9SPHN|nr:GNAT family N-acetyltransferase [Sphingomicrobium sp. B8]MBW0145453.1 GNAT family N-acetyltransferase [Sphingomicrobium sp. B8]
MFHLARSRAAAQQQAMGKRTTHEGELSRDDVQALLAQHFAEMRADSPPDACHVMTAERLDDPAILVLTLREENGTLAAVCALRTLDDDHGEIKSMRAADHARGTGAGKVMLDALIDRAKAAGMTRLSMETGNSPLFAAANRLYEGAGFTRCGPFAGYRPTPFTHFFTKRIA